MGATEQGVRMLFGLINDASPNGWAVMAAIGAAVVTLAGTIVVVVKAAIASNAKHNGELTRAVRDSTAATSENTAEIRELRSDMRVSRAAAEERDKSLYKAVERVEGAVKELGRETRDALSSVRRPA